MTAVSIGPIVTNSVTKLDRRLEGTCIGNFLWIVTVPNPSALFAALHRGCFSLEDVMMARGCVWVSGGSGRVTR
jgi:hypothetical protein